MKSRPSVEKRRKELARQERKREKAVRRAERKTEKALGPPSEGDELEPGMVDLEDGADAGETETETETETSPDSQKSADSDSSGFLPGSLPAPEQSHPIGAAEFNPPSMAGEKRDAG